MSCFGFRREKRGEGPSFRCALLSTGRNVLQKPGLQSWLECATLPGMLIRKLWKVELPPFPLEGPGRAGGWAPPPECTLGSCGPLPLGAPSVRAPRLGCPGPSLPVSRLMQELGIWTGCPLAGAGAAPACLPPPSSLLIFGIRGSAEMSVLLGAGLGACPSPALLEGRSPLAILDVTLKGEGRLLLPLNWGPSRRFTPWDPLGACPDRGVTEELGLTTAPDVSAGTQEGAGLP